MQILNCLGIVVPVVLASQQFPAMLSLVSLSPLLILALITVWGTAWALPFYIPPGLVALRLGGQHHAALLTNIFDAVGFFAGAVFSYYSMKAGRFGDWLPVFGACAAANLISLVSMNMAMRLDD